VPLRFFADHCASNQVVNALRAAGHEVLQLEEHMPEQSPGRYVIVKAQKPGRIPRQVHDLALTGGKTEQVYTGGR
jgi:hypothetical protein